MMGFIKPDQGSVTIGGLDSWKDATEIKKFVSYVPGEIAFPSLATGTDFLKLQADYLGIHDLTYMNHIISMLQLDPTANLKRMSKGMKQKTAITAALMGDKEVLILDEPTTGLDPLMRDSFIELIREEKEKGRTIFMSSHIFEEIEHICDQVAMIKDGRIVDTIDLWDLRHWKTKTFDICFKELDDYKGFLKKFHQIKDTDEENLFCRVEMPVSEIQQLFHVLKDLSVASLKEAHITLEQYFRQVYAKGED
jgi:ABC-2 type transport system ATP-binding protein